MTSMLDTTSYTASEARENLYALIRAASKGLRIFEIKLRGVEPVALVNKAELDYWLETLDVMSSPEEVEAIREGMRTKKTISHKQMLKEIGLK